LGKYGLKRGNKYLLYVGSDDPRKNLRTLILSFCQTAPQHLDAQLLVVGASHFPYQHKELSQIVAQMGMEHQICFIGPVPDTDLPYFYNLASLLVMPSLYEGFGLPVVEAMACGTRVLAVDRTSLPELTGVDSVLCPPTVEAMTQSIHMCLETEALPDSQVLRRQWTERFSWSNVGAQTQRVYDLVRS
jgi:glycosyltransferase involved in cell wall biosynthesis